MSKKEAMQLGPTIPSPAGGRNAGRTGKGPRVPKLKQEEIEELERRLQEARERADRESPDEESSEGEPDRPTDPRSGEGPEREHDRPTDPRGGEGPERVGRVQGAAEQAAAAQARDNAMKEITPKSQVPPEPGKGSRGDGQGKGGDAPALHFIGTPGEPRGLPENERHSPELMGWLQEADQEAAMMKARKGEKAHGKGMPVPPEYKGWKDASTGWGKGADYSANPKGRDWRQKAPAESPDRGEWGSFAHDSEAEREQQAHWEAIESEAQNRARFEREEKKEDEPDDAIVAALTALASKKEAGFRVGNLVVKLPSCGEPDKSMFGRLNQLANWSRDVSAYFKGTLFTMPVELHNRFMEESKTFHLVRISAPVEEGVDMIDNLPSIGGLTEKQREYFKIITPMLIQHVVTDVKDELEDFDTLTGADLLMALYIAMRRVYDVNQPSELEALERLARNPQISSYDALRTWWRVVKAAQGIGHVSWFQLSRGLIKLLDDFEAQRRFGPRVLRKLGDVAEKQQLDRFNATEPGVTTYVRVLSATLKEHPNKPSRAHLAHGDGHEEDRSPEETSPELAAEAAGGDAYETALAAQKPKGKGSGKGTGGGCFKCGASDHWSRECPHEAGKTGHAAGWKTSEQERTEQNLCYACGETGHHRWQCPKGLKGKDNKGPKGGPKGNKGPKDNKGPKGKNKARLSAALIALQAMFNEVDDEGEGAPPPEPPPT